MYTHTQTLIWVTNTVQWLLHDMNEGSIPGNARDLYVW
jgi:hypothetical protein